MTNALKCHLWRREPATLTHAAHAVTQLTKWTGGGNDPLFPNAQKGMAARDGHRKKDTPIFTDSKRKGSTTMQTKGGVFCFVRKASRRFFKLSEPRPGPAGRPRYRIQTEEIPPLFCKASRRNIFTIIGTAVRPGVFPTIRVNGNTHICL